MNKSKLEVPLKQPLFDLHLEYSALAIAKEKEYRDLENRFQFHFAFLPIRIENDTFLLLTEKQQAACTAFWTNQRVVGARKAMLAARTLAEFYFNAYVDSGKI